MATGDILNGGTLDDVANVGGKGLVVGAGVAATLALVRQVLEAKRQRDKKKKRESNEISPDTVVLRVRKQAEAQKPQNSLKIEGPESREVRPASTVGPRETNGRFTSVFGKEKEAGFVSDVGAGAGSILAALGGTVIGYAAVTKIAQKLEQQRLKRQIAAAQTEYINLLDGNTKTAEAFSTLFLFGDDTVNQVQDELYKQAGIPTDLYNAFSNTPRTVKGVSAGMLAAWILGAGASAYVAKRILENKFDKEDEEEPEKQTRILFKAGSSEFEISPEHMLATIGILRDCIADSTPSGEKTAAWQPDYSFLDTVAGMRGGRQWLLDQYAVQNGLPRAATSNFSLPLSMRLKYGKTLKSIRRNPELHAANINARVMDVMRRDPIGWFNLLGDPRNNDIVRLKANEQIANLDHADGALGALARVPVLGGVTKKLASAFMNSVAGSKMTANQILSQLGVVGDDAKAVLSNYSIGNGGWAPTYGAYKQAGALDDGLVAILSRGKTLGDKTNKDVLKAINELKEQRSGKKKHTSSVKVEFDKNLNGVLSEEDKRKLRKSLIHG